MPKDQQVAVTLRFGAETKALLQEAADRDHRSMSNMVEVLILNHCREAGIAAARRFPTRKPGKSVTTAKKPARSSAAKP